jgi:hypothetical protein
LSLNQEKQLINEQKQEIEKKLNEESELRKSKEKEIETIKLNLVSYFLKSQITFLNNKIIN